MQKMSVIGGPVFEIFKEEDGIGEEEGERHRIVIQHFLEAITDRGLPQHPPLCQWRTSIRRQVNSRYTDGYETGPGSA